VHREGDVLAVHVGDQVRNARQGLRIRVRKVAPEPDRVLEVLVVAVAHARDGEARRHGTGHDDREHNSENRTPRHTSLPSLE